MMIDNSHSFDISPLGAELFIENTVLNETSRKMRIQLNINLQETRLK